MININDFQFFWNLKLQIIFFSWKNFIFYNGGLSKYDGNIHPDEWINDIQNHFKVKQVSSDLCLEVAMSLVVPTIPLPAGIDSFEKLRNALKEDVSFILFKDTNKRILQSPTEVMMETANL